MADTRRNQLKTFVEREFIGPDPIDWEGTKQENGEEILSADAPSTRYIAGILFPGMVSEDSESESLQRYIWTPEQRVLHPEIPQCGENVYRQGG